MIFNGAKVWTNFIGLEDIGFYCVDNIPPKLIPVFYTLCEQAKPEMKRVAIVTDTRGGDMFSSLFETLDALRQEQKKYKILFLDCSHAEIDGVRHCLTEFAEKMERNKISYAPA